MARSLAVKLIIAFLLVSLAGILLVALLAGRVTATEFGAYTTARNLDPLLAELTAYYQQQGSWEGVLTAVFANSDETDQSGRGQTISGGRGLGQGQGGGSSYALLDHDGQIVIPGLGYRLGNSLLTQDVERERYLPVVVAGQSVGTLVIRQGQYSLAEQAFLDQVNQALLIAAIGATLVALLLGVLLARALTRPLQELTAATKRVAQGELGQQVTVRSRDELGDLAGSFNQMSRDLQQAQTMRRQMTADIAHDLRTPISVILSHAEALQDGVLPPTADTFHLIQDEARRLNRLVEDLRTLSLAEAGELPLNRWLVPPRFLLEQPLQGRLPEAKQREVTLKLDTVAELPDVYVDPDRMVQVFNNLLDNALRHTLPAGDIVLSARTEHDQVLFGIKNSGTGIRATELERIFDRFYRGDKSRQRAAGGSGLGLAIARSIVAAHNGRIWAESEPGQSATFWVALPVAGPQDNV